MLQSRHGGTCWQAGACRDRICEETPTKVPGQAGTVGEEILMGLYTNMYWYI
jgi:hypothetical protein